MERPTIGLTNLEGQFTTEYRVSDLAEVENTIAMLSEIISLPCGENPYTPRATYRFLCRQSFVFLARGKDGG
jgi:hypothetical protein